MECQRSYKGLLNGSAGALQTNQPRSLQRMRAVKPKLVKGPRILIWDIIYCNSFDNRNKGWSLCHGHSVRCRCCFCFCHENPIRWRKTCLNSIHPTGLKLYCSRLKKTMLCSVIYNNKPTAYACALWILVKISKMFIETLWIAGGGVMYARDVIIRYQSANVLWKRTETAMSWISSGRTNTCWCAREKVNK